MKKWILILFLSLSFILGIGNYNAFSQKWDTLSGKFQSPNAVRVLYADSNYIYAAGSFYDVGGIHMKGIARWNGVKWDSMGAGINGLDTLNLYPQNTLAITTYNNKLYVAGANSSVGKVNAPAIGTWDGSVWDSIYIQPFTNSHSDPSVSAMGVINNKLYVAGTFDTVAGFPCIDIAQWDDTNWKSLNFPSLKNNHEGFSTVCEYNGSIYVGGIFYGNTVGDTNSNIMRWDGANWLSVGGGIKGNAVDVQTMVVYQGELYVAGYFFQSDGNAGDFIQKWNGTTWSGVGGGTGRANGQIDKLLVYNGKLYAMGVFATAGGIPASKIAEWDGTQWCSLGSIFDNTIITSCIYKDSLYIGGGFWTIDGDSISYITEWIDGDYTANCGATGENGIINNNESATIFPNPSSGTFTLSLSNVSGKCSMEVYNVMGQNVLKETLRSTQGDNLIDLKNQPNGVYFYRVINEDGSLVGEGKVVIEK